MELLHIALVHRRRRTCIGVSRKRRAFRSELSGPRMGTPYFICSCGLSEETGQMVGFSLVLNSPVWLCISYRFKLSVLKCARHSMYPLPSNKHISCVTLDALVGLCD